MKRYEGLFILNTAGKEETIKETIDKIADEIKAHGGKVEGIQKMDKKPFARGDDKRKEGFYVNIIFQGPPAIVREVRPKIELSGLIYRQMYTREVPLPKFKEKKETAAVKA